MFIIAYINKNEYNILNLNWSYSCVLVLVDQIKEVRVGKNTDILRSKEIDGSYQDACFFSIIFGDNFDSLDLIANSADESNIWVTGLTCLITGKSKGGLFYCK